MYKTPKIGDRYCSKTYSILESAEEKKVSVGNINVCVVNEQ
jgi:hypothetical protein